MNFKISLAFFYFLIILFYPNISYAYLDPGTGGIIIQAILALIAFISAFFFGVKEKIKKFILRIRSLFKKKD